MILFHKFTIKTRLSYVQVLENLKRELDQEKGWIFFTFNPDKKFRGKLKNNRFQMHRMIRYQNAFIPIIKGEVRPLSDGTEVKISLRMHAIIYVFVFTWILIVGAPFWMEVFDLITVVPVKLVSVAMIIFGVGLMFFGYHLEARKVKKDLMDLFL